MKKFGVMLVLTVAVTAALGFPVHACVGARPMAMGGAFVALADDSSAVYWNPAGLMQIKEKELGLTYTLNNTDDFNYDFFLTYVEPEGDIKAAGGVSWIKERYLGVSGTGPVYYDNDWFAYSYAGRATSSLTWGLNVRYEKYSIEDAAGDSGLLDFGSRWALDLGLLYRFDPKVTLGLLLQDVSGTTVKWDSGTISNIPVNVRPGIAYRLDPATTLALDIYDLTGGTSEAQTVRFGAERRINENWALRLGYYGIRGESGAITVGAGYARGKAMFDYVYLSRGLSGADTGLGGTHQVGLRFVF